MFIFKHVLSQKKGSAYLNSVAEALEENGENGEAYRTLSDLRDSLDKVMDFYDGLIDYTDGVTELREGTEKFREETEDLEDTVNEKVDEMIDEKTGADVPIVSFTDERNEDVTDVQFVITTPSIHVQEEETDAEDETKQDTFFDKLRKLF